MMNDPIQLASWRRPKPPSVAPSAGASGMIHAGVLALALFGYPVIDIVFKPLSATPEDVLAYGESEQSLMMTAVSALDVSATDIAVETAGGIDTNDDVPIGSSGDHAWETEGVTLEPQTRAGKPDSVTVPPTANTAEPTKSGRPDGLTNGLSEKIATRELIVIVTLEPETPDRLNGSEDGNRQLADSDGTDDGQDSRSQAVQPATGRPGTAIAGLPASAVVPISNTPGDVDRGDLAESPELPESALGTAPTEAATGPYRVVADIVDPDSIQPNDNPRLAPNGIGTTETGKLINEAPRGGGLPAPEAAPAFSVDRTGDGVADQEKHKRLRDIVIAVTGNDERFARAILDPQPASQLGGLPDPAKQQRIRILQEAADAGYARAQYALARQYIIGEQPQETVREAIMLLREAAERGDVNAQLLLGVIYAEGKIARRDLVESQLYLTLAAAQGTSGIAEMINEIERDMTLQELIAARRIGRTYSNILSALDEPRLNGTRGDLLRDELLDAAAAGNTATIARALARGADLEATDGAGRTAVINAAWRGRADAIDLLLSVGADIDTRDDRGRTALTWAASNGHVDIVRQLVDNDAEIDPVDRDGTTPLMRAAWNGHREVVETLVAAGADTEQRDPQGLALADYLARSGTAGAVPAPAKPFSH